MIAVLKKPAQAGFFVFKHFQSVMLFRQELPNNSYRYRLHHYQLRLVIQ